MKARLTRHYCTDNFGVAINSPVKQGKPDFAAWAREYDSKKQRHNRRRRHR